MALLATAVRTKIPVLVFVPMPMVAGGTALAGRHLAVFHGLGRPVCQVTRVTAHRRRRPFFPTP